MRTARTITATILSSSAILFAATAAQAGGWLERASGGTLRTPEPIRKIAPNGISISRPSESGSSLMVIVHYIRRDGTVMYGSNTGNVRPIGKAKLVRNSSGKAFWVAKGAENSPLPAGPQYDLVKTYRSEVDASSGTLYRWTYVNGKRTGERVVVLRLPVRYTAQGRPYYSFNGQTYFATNVPWRQPSQPNYPTYPQGPQFVNGQQQPLKPGAAITLGILQAIQQGVNGRQ